MKPRRDIDRELKMAEMYRQGLTLQKIGDHFGVTRERVRQLIGRHGLDGDDGGRQKVRERTLARKRAVDDARDLAKYGLTREQRRHLSRIGAMKAFHEQERNAAHRNIEWKLSLSDWWSVWEASGKWEQRGRSGDGYVMSRVRDDGPYELGNVHIQTLRENSREAVAKWRGKKKALRGVFHLYPGLARGWVAKFRKKHLGYYATAEEAAWARASAMELHGMTA